MRNERAKIFAPFSPLKGMDRAYKEKERVITPRAELMSDRIEEIDRKLRGIKKGMLVEVTYYTDKGYKTHVGEVSSVSPEKHMFNLDLPINFGDIYDIRVR
ncbi:MAG: hypothetical protein IKU45_06740 [Clostridia bacterium]|nr:hypothetical protein [Clostridia bacterium]